MSEALKEKEIDEKKINKGDKRNESCIQRTRYPFLYINLFCTTKQLEREM